MDYHAILGVRSDATDAEIKQAYRRLAHRYHPDRNSAPDAAEQFRRVREAYEALMSGRKSRQTKAKKAADEAAKTAQTEREQWRPLSSWEQAYDIYKASIRHVFAEKIRLFRMFETNRLGETEYGYRIHQLGAYAAAKSKEAKRCFVIGVLAEARKSGLGNLKQAIGTNMPVINHETAAIGLDITPTLANHFAKEVLGRGFDLSVLNAAFGTPGRTAANKTTVTTADMDDLKQVCQKGLAALEARVSELRAHYRVLYEMRKKA
jgi:curved DNA-binding protein CbpA